MYTQCLVVAAQLITESLPVSSSGHVQLLLRSMSRSAAQPIVLVQAYEYLLHGPTSVILAIYFRSRWLFLLRHMVRCRRVIARLLLLGLCAEIPTALWYVAWSRIMPTFPLWMGFFITSCLLLSLMYCDRYQLKQTARITMLHAAIIGCVQGLALLPGISRLGSTYVIGRWLGLKPSTSFLFSCTIEWPIITAGFFKGLYEFGLAGALSISSGMMFCVLIASVVSYVVLKATVELMVHKVLWPLGIYMLIPMLLALIL